MAVSLWGNCNLELWQTMCIIHNWAQKMCLRHNWDWVGFPRNSRCCCASVSRFLHEMTFLHEISHHFRINTKPSLHEIAHSFKITIYFLHEIADEYIISHNFCMILRMNIWTVWCELVSVNSNFHISSILFMNNR